MGAQGMTGQTLAALSDLRQTRQTLAALVDALPEEALITIPEGFNNHILWNVGHLVVTQQVLVYGLSGLQPNVSAEMMGAFRKGTSPRDWDRAWTLAEIREPFLSLPDQTEADLRAGRFETYREYTTTPGVTLRSVDDAVRFNQYHEGIHLGSVLALRKLVG